jgi:hypothetical protein
MKTMVNDRLQPTRTAPVMKILLIMVGALGMATGTAWTGQVPSATVLPPNAVTRQAPSLLAERAAVEPPARTQAKPRHKRAPVRVSHKGSSTPEVSSTRTPKERIVSTAAGRRDPFKAWQPPGSGGQVGSGLAPGALPPGIRGLVISQLRVAGIVRKETANRMIAVVTNYTKRAYFLKENDAVYNGVVSRITPDAVHFKENSLDSNGRVTTHDVVVRIGSTAGEGR